MPNVPVPTVPPLHTCVVIDYQNMHLVGHDAFESSDHLDKHETLIDPLLFANRLIAARNEAQRPGYRRAVLDRVLVYRGLPDAEYDSVNNARSQKQKHHWERDNRVKVNYRPLRYDLHRGVDGKPIRDVNGKVTIFEVKEKGIDVLCALALVREAQLPGTDLVILASHDTDLIPAIDEALDLGNAKVETVRWHTSAPGRYTNRIKPTNNVPIWTTWLGEDDFIACRDLTDYS